MDRFRLTVFIGFILLSPLLVVSQSSRNHEEKGNQERSVHPSFLRCLEQILPFPEGEVNGVEEQISTCNKLIQKGVLVSKIHRLDFAIRQMKFQQSLDRNEALLKLVLDNKDLAIQDGIPPSLKNNYFYIAAKTQSFFGDIPNAVNTYINLLSDAEKDLDTTYILHSLYDLGQLYEAQEDYSKAEQYFQQAHNFVKYNSVTNDFQVQLLEAIIEMHLKAEQFDKARPFIKEGLKFSEKYNNSENKFRFTLWKGKLDLLLDDIVSGEEAYKEAAKYKTYLEEEWMNKRYKVFLADYYLANTRFDEAIVAYEDLMLEEESLEKTKEWTNRAHEAYLLKGDHEMAYENLLHSTVLEKHIQHKRKEQQSFYNKQIATLDNSMKTDEALAVKFSNEKNQNIFVYAFGLMSLISLVLFYLLKREQRSRNKKINDRLEDRTKELELVITRLKESQKEANAFNKILTHDLRGPLRNIIGFSALARKEITDNSNTSNYLRYVLKGGKQLRQLITDVAVFQEVNNKPPEPMELIDTNVLMKSLVESMDVLLEEIGGEINFPELPSVVGHQPTLFSSFKHLIENGIKYNNSNTPVVEVQYFRNVDTHFFQIKDNGIGISSTYHESIFELFKRLNGRRFCEGSGLGLNVSQKLLEKLGGKITILESEEGKGSTFQISFPILKEPKTIVVDVEINEKEKLSYEL